MKQLILGGARSGKSRYAEMQAVNGGKQVIYIATATIGDDEMEQRISLHQQRRPDCWQLIEEPLYLSKALRASDGVSHCILVDCLTLWLSNSLAESAIDRGQQQNELIETLHTLQADVILVSNEVGQGIVPMGELTRTFVDESGRMHQRLAEVCEQVVFMTAGIAQVLKSDSFLGTR